MMYRDRDKAASRVQSLWSVLKYDVGTAIDVLDLPCLVRLTESDVNTIFDDVTTNGFSGECRVKFERKVSFYSVRARVSELNDIDWYTWCKGEDFVAQHRRLVGTEFFIPVDYKGKIRLSERTQNREYFSISEVINDFPKFVQVERDTACFSPGDINYHVIHKGAVLELDRVTQNNRSPTGSRDKFLICFDRSDGREIAFRVMSPVHFRKLHDNSKYTVKEFIEQLPLPHKVEFINVNPYDIVIADDNTANDLLVMLSGPVELLEPKRSEYLIGRIQHPISGETNVLALPTDGDTLDNYLVYIPSSSIMEDKKDYANTVIPGETDCDLLRQKLFSNSPDVTSPILLVCDMNPSGVYDIADPPDTPPLPPKYDFATLRSTLSEQHVASDEFPDAKMETCRRRYLSTGDLKGARSRTSLGSVDREALGIKGYLSHLSHRFKSRATQLFYGIENHPDSGFRSETRISSPRRLSFRSLVLKKQTPPTESSFVCYLNCANDEVFPTSTIGNTSPTLHEKIAVEHSDSSRDEERRSVESTNRGSSNLSTDSSSNHVSRNVANHTATNPLFNKTLNHNGNSTDIRNSTSALTDDTPNPSNDNTTNHISKNSVADKPPDQSCSNQSTKSASPQVSINTTSGEVIYATVQKVKKGVRKNNANGHIFLCQICRETSEQSSITEE